MRANCLPGACVSILVGGENAAEYGLENDATKATALIEAIPGANFAIVVDIERGFAYSKPQDYIECLIFLDGQCAVSKLITPHHANTVQKKVEGRIQDMKGVDMFREFRFMELKSTEDVAPVSVLKKFASIGEIRVDMRRCRVSGVSNRERGHSGFKEIEDAVPEKALKGRSISSQTMLGPGKAVQKRGRVNTTYPYGKVPIASYIFRYRTRRDLEIEGVVEQPVPLEERDPKDLTPDELREQVRLLRAAASKVKIKEELKREKRARSVTLVGDDDDDGGDGDVTITGVTDRHKRAKVSAESVEVLDLTGD